MTKTEKKQAFTETLFLWHKTHYRDMPWRNTRNPYRILVSEIMLQQTQVDRVRAKYVEFLKKFPNIQALAKVSLGEVLRVWSGLGYNRRARYLHDCAKKIVLLHGGKFPDNLEELKKLPGIGLSTAGALLAFSFRKDEPMIDTNIRRVLARVFFGKRSDLVPRDRELYHFAKLLIPSGRGREWNYAMLDLGAMLCTARNHSLECPLTKLHGEVGDFRYKKPQKKFADSDRYYRGRIISLLAKKRASRLETIERALGLSNKTHRVSLPEGSSTGYSARGTRGVFLEAESAAADTDFSASPPQSRGVLHTNKKIRAIIGKLLLEGLVKKRGQLFLLP